ncbi:MAG: gamma-glutamyltransferase [Gorillibacterium sp.]|nr:gamma-glutamyltransferase [Gorillibacterium sp.]
MNSSVVGSQTMVVSPHYLATEAGARILQKGGNAFDAAVAISACLGVVYPHMTGMGGDSFWLTFSSGDNRVRVYNGSGRSGHQVNRAQFAGEAAIPQRGARSAITVPGMIDSWDAINREYGCLSLAEVLEQAIAYANNGFPMSRDQYEQTDTAFSLLSSMPNTANIYLPSGRVIRQGHPFLQKDLAASLREIAAGGRDAFYKGRIAAEIVAFLKKQGGLLTEDDFASHQGEWMEPMSGTYRGQTIYQAPPNSQGFVAIMALQILEQYDLQGIDHGSFDYYHLLIEALKISFRDRDQVLTDPDFHSIPLKHLLSEEYTRKLAASLNTHYADEQEPGPPMGGDTAYAAVIDKEGNAVSFIQSLYYEFGSGIVAGNTGILMQNRGAFFSLNPAHINRLEPNKRTFHTLMPAMACLGGKPTILCGTQGGEGQPQTQIALFTRMIDYDMDPQQAIEAPRWVWGRTWGDQPAQLLRVESRIPIDVQHALAQAGHQVHVVKAFDGAVGHAGAIRINEQGMRSGGFDPRSDGAAIGW